MDNFKKIIFIFGKDKFHLIPLTLSFIVLSFLEVLGIGFLGVFVTNIVDQNISSNEILQKVIQNFPILNEIIFNLKYLSIIIIIAFFLKSLITFSINFYIEYFTKIVALKVRNRLIDGFLSENIYSINKKNISKYIETIIRLVEIFQGACISSLIRIFSDILILFFVSIIIIYSSSGLTTIGIIVFFILGYLYVSFLGPKLKKYAKLHSESSKDIIRSTYEMIIGISEIKSYDKKSFFKEKFDRFNNKVFINSLKGDLPNLFTRPFFEFVLTVVIISIFLFLGIGNEDVQDNLLTISIICLSLLRIFPIINSLISSQNRYNSSKYAVSEIYSSLTERLNKDQSRKKIITEFKHLKFNKVSFKYSNETVISKISFNIKKNSINGIIGRSGSGKTTLVSIILGNLQNYEGEINVNDNYDLKDINLDEWIKIFSYIPQETYLFNDTIANNISLDNNYDEEAIFECLRAVGLNEFCNKEKISSLVGDRGTQLSGGQRQRISIARSLYHKKNFIIFDEPTSQLDVKNSKIILETIKNISKDKTIIIISHDKDMMRYCENIIELE